MSRMLELFFEVVGWVLIVFSMTLIGSLLFFVIYYPGASSIRLVSGILVILTGLILGIRLANKMWRTKGTIWFISRVSASPEMDEPEVREEKKTN